MSFLDGGIFGQPQPTNTNAAAPAAERPKAQYWLNLGYVVKTPNAQNPQLIEDRFISLPFGLAIDTMSSIEKFSRNAAIAKMQSASNDLLKQMQAAFESMKPGDEKVLDGDCQGLRIQLRRVGETPTEVANEGNEFVQTITF